MHPFVNEYTVMIAALTEASTKIASIDTPELLLLRNKTVMELNRQINFMKVQLGIDIFQGPISVIQDDIKAHVPLSKVLGKDVTKKLPVMDVNRPGRQTANDVEAVELQMKADELAPRFLSTSSDHLLDSVSDIEIRAVAKKYGLPVTENNPARITTSYIDEVRLAIQKANASGFVPEASAQIFPLDNISLDPSSGDTVQATIIHKPGTNGVSTAQKLTSDEERELAEINLLYNNFLDLETGPLLTDGNHLHIRAVAKLAGLPVTLNSPKRIDGKFIEMVKTAIRKKADLEAKGNKV